MLKEVNYTKEQKDIIESVPNQNTIIVNAIAGSGKTSTLVGCAKKLNEMGMKTHYMVFNNAMSKEAKPKFSEHNCTVSTWHSFALKFQRNEIMHKLTYKGGFGSNFYTGAELMKHIDYSVPNGYLFTRGQIGWFTIYTINNFCYSTNKNITVKNIPYDVKFALDNFIQKGGVLKEHAEKVRKDIVSNANKVWKDIMDVSNDFPMTHDHYLKRFQLNGFDIGTFCECLVVDEFQDTNPVCMDLIKKSNIKKLIIIGDDFQNIYCQPDGTKVMKLDGFDKNNPDKRSYCTKSKLEPTNIEDIKVGDYVASYSIPKKYYKKSGNKVTNVSKRAISEEIIEIETVNTKLKSRYTKNHHCLVRINNKKAKDKYVIYLMKKDNNYRIGMIPFLYKSQNNTFGVSIRSSVEQADMSWILEVVDTRDIALEKEIILQWKYGLPSLCFRDHGSKLNIENIWSHIGNNKDAALRCLGDYGLLHNEPLYMSENYKQETEISKGRIATRLPFVTAACNLNEYMDVLPYDALIKGRRFKPSDWENIKIQKYNYTGFVHSISVENDHTYIADGIITHNSWRGSVNALDKVKGKKLSITESFRINKDTAKLANNVLSIAYKNFPKNIRGSGPSKNASGDAYICRTNAGCADVAYKYLQENKKFFMKNVYKIKTSILEIFKIYKGDIDGKPHKSYKYPFTDWDELKDYSKYADDCDLSIGIKFVEKFRFKTLKTIDLICENSVKGQGTEIITAHSSKGLEWKNVIIHDDFVYYDHDLMIEKLRTEKPDINALYVAVTRGSESVELHPRLEKHVKLIKEK